MPRTPPSFLLLQSWLLPFQLLCVFHLPSPFHPAPLLERERHKPSPVFRHLPRHPPSTAAFPSPPVTPPTDLPSDLPYRMAPAASLATPSPTHSPRSLARSSFAAPPGSQNTDPQDTVPRSPGALACGCNTAPIDGSSPALPQNSQTAPEPKTPRKSSSKTAPPSPESSDDAVAI